MKTAEEWANEKFSFGADTKYDFIEEVLKQIQLDAFKAGERFAAEIGYKEATVNVNPQSTSIAVILVLSTAGIAKKAILTDANNRTEIPR